MARFLTAAFLLFTLVELTFAGQREDLIRQAKAATALIVAVEDTPLSVSLGSGFFIDPDGLLITNAHIVEHSRRLYVYVRDQEVYHETDVLAVDSDLDLAALRLRSARVDALALAVENPADGTDVMAVGYPRITDILHMGFTLHPTMVPGTVSGLAQGQSRTKGRAASFVQTTGLLNLGNSGGPLVRTDTGEVVAMVVTTVPYLERAKDRNGVAIGSVMMKTGIGYSVPAPVIRDWLEKNRVQPLASPAAPRLPGPRTTGPEAQANRSYATGHLLHALATALQGDVDLLNLALRHYETAAGLHPGAPWVFRSLGHVYAALGRWDQAREAYGQAIQLAPLDSELLGDAARAWQRTGRADRAVELYRAALSLNPRSERTHNNLGSLLWEMGRKDEAAEEFRRALEADPASAGAAYNLGLTLAANGLHEEAVELWESFLAQHGAASKSEGLHDKMREAVARHKPALELGRTSEAGPDSGR
jgi:tetratricopeptide (TPR) repeat protein